MRWNACAIFGLLAFATGSSAQTAGAQPSDASRPSIDDLTRDCNNNYPDACDILGMRYLNGDGVAKDEAAATAMFKRACDLGDAEGCYDLAFSYDKGQGVQQDDHLSASAANRSCNGGYLPGCDIMGIVFERGLGGYPEDRARASMLYQRACNGGIPEACAHLADLTATLPPTRAPPTTAVTAPLPRASATPPPEIRISQFDAGLAAHSRKDFAAAAQKFAEACDLSVALACFRLGEQYSAGLGVNTNKKLAASLYAKACDDGVAPACASLGLAYDGGTGVAKNRELAAKLYKKACDGAFTDACILQATLAKDGTALGETRVKAVTQELENSLAAEQAFKVTEAAWRNLTGFSRLCLGGNLKACAAVANVLRNSASEKPQWSNATALEAMRKLCRDKKVIDSEEYCEVTYIAKFRNEQDARFPDQSYPGSCFSYRVITHDTETCDQDVFGNLSSCKTHHHEDGLVYTNRCSYTVMVDYNGLTPGVHTYAPGEAASVGMFDGINWVVRKEQYGRPQ